MSYAVRKDGLGWRAVGSNADVLDTEIFSATEPILTPTAEQIDSEKKSQLQKYWDGLEITINDKTFLGNQNNCTLMELKKATLMDAEQTTFPAKYGFVATDKIELQQVLNEVSALLDAKKLEIWGE